MFDELTGMRAALKRLNEVYFSNSGHFLNYEKGEMVVAQGEECHRLYLIRKGTLVAYRHEDKPEGSNLPGETGTRNYEVFRVEEGSYVCVQSFFSRAFHSTNDIFAVEDTELAYIDDNVAVVDEETYGSLEHQFLPVLIHELNARNGRIFGHAAEKEEAQRLLQRAEMATTLSQLTAGIAHELNNAVGVIERRMQFVAEQLAYCLAEENPLNSKLFTLGFVDKSYVNAADLRNAARRFERELKLPQEAARVLAHLVPADQPLNKLEKKYIKHLRENYRYWELGHDLRDMQIASRHATGIVRAVKMLGGGHTTRTQDTDVNESLRDAMNLLTNKLKHLHVETSFGELPGLTADVTELVQIWANIIKNACDAMEQANTPEPALRISTSTYHAEGLRLLPTDYIRVSIANNGPAIPEEIQEKIFQPNFTTKKLGLDFGLGLGLSIVRRVVDSYKGTIELESDEAQTTFTIHLPLIEDENPDTCQS